MLCPYDDLYLTKLQSAVNKELLTISNEFMDINHVHLENCSSFPMKRNKPSSPNPFSQIWEKGSRKVVPLPTWERDLG
jgi:hypothetical protein